MGLQLLRLPEAVLGLEVKHRPHWYFIYVRECAYCGRTIVERERRYDEKPALHADRYEYTQDFCQGHFL